MYTKEDIEKAKQYLDNEGYGTGSNFTLNTVANLMAEYAAKNFVGRSEQLVCDHPDEAIIRDKPTDYCLACNRNI